jgi:hypothetical protein
METEPLEVLYDWFWGQDELYTGLDGSVWLGTKGGRPRLGEPGRLKPAGDDERFWVSSDGTPWLLGGDLRLYSYDGDAWRTRFDGRYAAKRMRLRLTSDDDVWLVLSEARLERWSIGDDGTARIMRRGWFFHYDGQEWSPMGRYPRWDIMSHHRIWLLGFPTWTLAPDGTLWWTLGFSTCRPGTGGWGCQPYVPACEGLAHFDGERWTRHLRDRCVAEFDFSPDGTVWARAMTAAPGPTVTAYTGKDAWQNEDGSPVEPEMETLELGPVELYVITPEAVAAAE